ncbi:hypothetical protein BpHYR1_039976 [Brachionus plicatilis]|uniref:Uncharacterized protein n=1 Tax=Brachionus plicatilis TaxID=10195 RepID=A0A3M7SIR1_BRAPC|nr:hypothetical protein BpHYR1_039976 [Brachionus plicatilis]
MDLLLNDFEKLNLFQSQEKKDGSVSYLLQDEKNHEYKTSYEACSGLITWRCNNPDYPNCPGKVTTNGHRYPICLKINHLDECKPKIKTKVKQVTASIKDMALKNPDSKPRKIILECTLQNATKSIDYLKNISLFFEY